MHIYISIANCGHQDLLSNFSNDSVPRIEGYDGLPIEGSTVYFRCPPGLELIEPNLTICKENGEWDPKLNISGLMCYTSKGKLLSQFVHMKMYNMYTIYTCMHACQIQHIYTIR